MTPTFLAYTVLWACACLAALFLVIGHPRAFAFTGRQYYIFLGKPWKLWLFALGISFVTFVAPFSGDCTWDYFDGAVMSALTFLTAPWSVGIFYRAFVRKDRLSLPQIFVAGCLWMFSASWSYDLYVFLRYGYYPPTWAANMVLSSMLYGCGGLLWNLDWTRERGVFFSFSSPAGAWLTVSPGRVFPQLIKRGWIYPVIVLTLCGAIIYGLHNGGKLW